MANGKILEVTQMHGLVNSLASHLSTPALTVDRSQCSPPCQPASHTELYNQCTLFPPRTSQPLTWRADRPRPLPLSIPTPASGSNTSTDLTDAIPDPRCSYGLFHTHHSFANEKLFDPALPANRFRTSFWLALVDGTVPKQEGLSLS